MVLTVATQNQVDSESPTGPLLSPGPPTLTLTSLSKTGRSLGTHVTTNSLYSQTYTSDVLLPPKCWDSSLCLDDWFIQHWAGSQGFVYTKQAFHLL